MVENITVTGTRKKPLTNDLTVYINNKILTRFKSFSVSHSIDTVPMSFSLEYALSEGEASTEILNFTSKNDDPEKRIVSSVLTIGSRIEIYLEKQKILTGYVENSSESYSHEEHTLFIDGRSKTSVLVDSTTNLNQAGIIPDNLVSLHDIADYMFSGFGINTIDKTGLLTPKRPLAGYAYYDLTTHPYDFVSSLAQYEGVLLYDDPYGQMVIDTVPEATDNKSASNTSTCSISSSSSKASLTESNSKFENITVHKTSLGRYRNYQIVMDAYGGPAGVDKSIITIPSVADPYPNELPPGKNITIVSHASYPDTDSQMNELVAFQTDLAQFMANNNWGRGQTISALATGYINPITKKLWKVNDVVHFNYKKPFIKGDFVVQSIMFSIDEYSGKQTSLVFVRREALLQEPITISPIIMGVNPPDNKDSTDSSKPVNQKLNVPDDTPPNAKPISV